ncbi:hypothetical protein OPT61_g6864 [Boeremia exigua]|uniref:Uncharacterized protein n=1 Tax=Boeremia exigua TaxID=749465 RepID=A0ACC2I4E7_9PLEO|nr:hypothetical protein OPT61_g6864 [Boeremia exigua]
MDPKELAIQSAIADFDSGVFKSVRAAARWWGVPRSTLQGRAAGQLPHAIAHSNQQRLTPGQEHFLVEWILEEDTRSAPPSHPRVREMATQILHMNDDYEPLGQLWVPHFIARNPRVASIVGRKIESARTTAANYETVRAFLELFERTRVELVVKLRYCKQIQALSTLDNAAPVKKERFVTLYNLAQEEGLSEQVSAQALYKAQQLLSQSENLSRSTQLVLRKAGKSIAMKNTQAAKLQAENQSLRHQLQSSKNTYLKKRVQVNPNKRFSNVEVIKAAINHAAALQAQEATLTPEKQAQKAAAAAAAASLDSLCDYDLQPTAYVLIGTAPQHSTDNIALVTHVDMEDSTMQSRTQSLCVTLFAPGMATVQDVRFEHYHPSHTLGVNETSPRLSWKVTASPNNFKQLGYEIELTHLAKDSEDLKCVAKVVSTTSTLVPWPFEHLLLSRQRISIRVRLHTTEAYVTEWSEPVFLETGLLNRSDWQCDRIAAPWAGEVTGRGTEVLFRRTFSTRNLVASARIYITSQGVYEAEINGSRIGDDFLAPGWTAYEGRLLYQTYDVTSMILSSGDNCLGVRLAEGWFCGRLGWEGGHRNIWGPHPSLMAQLEITYDDGSKDYVVSGPDWTATRGPIRLAELYDGEKYDATLEVPDWSFSGTVTGDWVAVVKMPDLPETTLLTSGTSGPVKRVEVLQPVAVKQSPSGKTLIDFGQNLVGYVRLKNIRGRKGHRITIKHAEVLEHGEICTRPLRVCEAVDTYTMRGGVECETYEPRFTFHGFRYAQVDDWPATLQPSDIEAVVCHTEMRRAGSFTCSDRLLNQLHQNIYWGMRGNFLSVPTDCPQRDERLGWSGDLAMFAPTAVLIYDCMAMLSNWLVDVEYDQSVLGGVPPMVSPNSTIVDPVWCRRIPCAIWHDVTILAPWALYEETGDTAILARQYQSMLTWMSVLPRNKDGATHLWDNSVFQLGDWLDPAAPPDAPWKSHTDAKMVANMFLIHSLELIGRISEILGHEAEAQGFRLEAQAARSQFHEEYITSNGRLVSDTQAAYALAICFDLLTPSQRNRASSRLVELVRKNNFRIATGFAATPYICEALACTGNVQVAYAMLLEQGCPSWLYAVAMGATTVWERWDSMLPDGSVNPGEMTSFNHYAYGAVAKFMHERVAGLQRLEPGWTRCRIEPAIGATFTNASVSHETPFGTVSCSWTRTKGEDNVETFKLELLVPHGVTAEVVLPEGTGQKHAVVGAGEWNFQSSFKPHYEWPILPLEAKS